MRFWTKQHSMVLKTLLETGRYTAGRKNLFADLQEHAPLMLEAYDWLSVHHPGLAAKPPEAECVVWLSYTRDAAMVPDEAGVLLELEIPPKLVTPVNIAEWGMILNYAYIPAGEEDGQAHRKKLKALGFSDAKVCMSHFYPELKQEITDSWQRLFDPSVSAGNDSCYGTVWELRKEWLVQVL